MAVSEPHAEPHAGPRQPRGRLAPSPTGYLHIGNARSFLLAWLQMRNVGGQIILRIEDLDAQRATPNAATQIVRDLRWLGLDWDNPLADDYFQSNRFPIYQEALAELQARGLVYPCFCSRKELRSIASAPHGSDGPIYPGTCRQLSPQQQQQRSRQKSPALRFAVQPGTVVTHHDGVAGLQREEVSQSTGDFIVARADGVVSYQLAVVVDDLRMGITHVLRGDDLLGSTPRQILLHNTFGGTPPTFAHVPLILGPDGVRLAKRHGSVSVEELRERGVAAQQLVGWLAWSCGVIDRPEPVSAAELIAEFSIKKITNKLTQLDDSRALFGRFPLPAR